MKDSVLLQERDFLQVALPADKFRNKGICPICGSTLVPYMHPRVKCGLGKPGTWHCFAEPYEHVFEEVKE